MDKTTAKTYSPPSAAYPVVWIDHIKDPNRFYAFFVLGFVFKVIILIPQFIELIFLAIIAAVLSIINSFVVLFTGKYWDTAYDFLLGLMKFHAKIYFFFTGLTNKYPGFDFSLPDASMKIAIAKPTNPSRFFAFPVIGGLARIILLIPYCIYESVLSHGAWIGVVFSSFPALFQGKYPESTYEFTRDTQRVMLASSAYMIGFSDKYPNFWISMNHQTIKIILIIAGAVLALGNFSADLKPRDNYYQNNQMQQYNNTMEQAPSQTSGY